MVSKKVSISDMVPLVITMRVLEIYGNETEQGRKVGAKATDMEGQS